MFTPLKILIVEDSEDDVALLVRELREGPWKVAHQRVDTPDLMRDALKSQAWDLIIADYSMPQFSGPAALAMARQHAVGIPFILVSGNLAAETAVQAMKAGADDYILKGDLSRLVPAVQRELRDSDERRRARDIEEQLRKRDAQLAAAQRLANLGTWHLDLRTNLAVWSDEACRILGRACGQTAPTFDEFMACLHPDDRSRITVALHERYRTHIAHDCQISAPKVPQNSYISAVT